jgi:DNA-binding NarL/FixJ family response regulator
VVGIAWGLEVLSWLAVRCGRPERAALLVGAADALWARTGSRLGGVCVMTQAHQDAVRRGRERLGAAQFESMRVYGTELPLDLVVQRAIAGVELAQPGGGEGPPRPRPAVLSSLTKREREIACMVGNGLSNREIAARLVISKRTVDAHVEHIFCKLEISSRVQLAVWLQELGSRAPVAGG